MSISTSERHGAPEFDSAGLRALFPHASVKAFAKNALIITEGNRTDDSVYLVESGRVKVFLSNADGKEIVVSVLGPGDFFGETELDAGPRSVSAMTVEPSKLVVIRNSEFRRFIEEDPQFAMGLILKLISRKRDLLKTVKSLALMDVSDRVAQLLLEMATEENGKLIISEKLSKRHIANRVGATREMASRVFRDLVASGYIEMENKKITISKKMAGLLVSGGLVGLLFVLVPTADQPTLPAGNIASAVNALPATGAGQPSSVTPAASARDPASFSDIVAAGRVKQIYVRTTDGVLVEATHAETLQNRNAERWVDVEFPEPVAGAAGPVRAMLDDFREPFGVGDIVEVRFPNAREPVKSTAAPAPRVAGIVARKDDETAREIERRVVSRTPAPSTPSK